MGSHTWVIEPDVQDLISKMKMLYDSRKKAIPRNLKIKTWEEVGKVYHTAIKAVHEYPRVKRTHGN